MRAQLEVDWSSECPRELRGAAEPILRRWLPVLPAWVQYFRVTYRASRSNDAAAINLHYSNRWAVLILTADWITQPDDEREAALVHELVHAGFEPVSDAFDRIVEAVGEEDGALRKLAASMFKAGLESAVEDMARSLLACSGILNIPPREAGEEE